MYIQCVFINVKKNKGYLSKYVFSLYSQFYVYLYIIIVKQHYISNTVNTTSTLFFS